MQNFSFLGLFFKEMPDPLCHGKRKGTLWGLHPLKLSVFTTDLLAGERDHCRIYRLNLSSGSHNRWQLGRCLYLYICPYLTCPVYVKGDGRPLQPIRHPQAGNSWSGGRFPSGTKLPRPKSSG